MNQALRRATIGFVLVFASPFVLAVVYMLLAVILGLIPARDGASSNDGSVVVYLVGNGAHADLVVPVVAEGVDWRVILPDDTIRPMASVADDLAIGWGDREVYLNTPHLADLRFATAVRALLGLGATVVHVEAARKPVAGTLFRRIRLSGSRYRTLAAALARSFKRDAQGTAIAIPGAHYGREDAFFEAEGRYSPFMTCNEWARRILAAADVRVPLWAPFENALFYQLPREP